ncbi:rod shape-determining protein RodA [Bacteroidia bacterium]|nr:rod shape-determining protein RodA [Bacteroidia bacterium]
MLSRKNFDIEKNIKRQGQARTTIWIIVGLLAVFSVPLVLSAYWKELIDHPNIGSWSGILWKQIAIVFLGMGVMWIGSIIPYKEWFPKITTALMVIILLLLATAFVQGAVKGLRIESWRSVYVTKAIRFQPSDFAKIVLILYIAKEISVAIKEGSIKSLKVFLRILIPTLLMCGMIFIPNMSTAGLIFIIAFVMMLVGGIRTKYLVITSLITIVVVGGLLAVAAPAPTANARVSRNIVTKNIVKIHDRLFAEGKAAQADIAKAAIANSPKGVGNGIFKKKLPEAHNDFVFAVICEEYSIWVGIFICFLYLNLIFLATFIWWRTSGNFYSLLVLGILVMLVAQTLIHLLYNVGIFPTTGQAMPLLSKGGTSFVMWCLCFGIMLRVSKAANKPEDEATIPEGSEKIEIASKNNMPEGQLDNKIKEP